MSDEALDRRTQQLAAQLRCLVCQNQTIAESHAPLAVDLKNQVREQLAAGRSETEVLDYMTARYGDFVLYKPRMTAKTAILWGGPVLMLLLGVFAAVRFIRKRAEEADIATETDQAGPEAGQS